MPFGILASCVYYTVENVAYSVVETHGSCPLSAREIGVLHTNTHLLSEVIKVS